MCVCARVCVCVCVLLLIVKTTVLHVKIAYHRLHILALQHLPKLYWCHKLCISLSTSPPSNASRRQRAQRDEGCENQDLVTPARAENGNEAAMEECCLWVPNLMRGCPLIQAGMAASFCLRICTFIAPLCPLSRNC